jgi:hypothetical protein
MTVMASTALRQPFLSALGDMTRGVPWRALTLRRHINLGQVRTGGRGWGMRGSIWLIAQGEHK